MTAELWTSPAMFSRGSVPAACALRRLTPGSHLLPQPFPRRGCPSELSPADETWGVSSLLFPARQPRQRSPPGARLPGRWEGCQTRGGSSKHPRLHGMGTARQRMQKHLAHTCSKASPLPPLPVPPCTGSKGPCIPPYLYPRCDKGNVPLPPHRSGQREGRAAPEEGSSPPTPPACHRHGFPNGAISPFLPWESRRSRAVLAVRNIR